MSTRKSKKLLSAFLAAVMVLSSFVITPISSFAATHSLDDLEQLMTGYEQKMADGKTYTNLESAYDAWYDAYVTAVGVKAGTVADSQIDTAYANLESALSGMQEWTSPTGTSSVYSRAGDGDDAIPSDYAKNILFASRVAENGNLWSSKQKNCTVQMQYSPVTVALYDGSNTIRIPVAFAYSNSTTGYRYVYACFPTDNATSGEPAADSTNFALQGSWHGGGSNCNWNAAWAATGAQCAGYKNAQGISSSNSTDRVGMNRWLTYANYMDYIGDNGGFINGVKTIQPGWYAYSTYRSADNANHYMTNVSKIMLVDYTALKQAVAATNELGKITTYTYSTAKALLSAIDSATAFDPNSKFSATTEDSAVTDTAACAAEIDAKITAITNAKNNLSAANKESYMSLAASYSAYKALYDGDNSTGYYEQTSFDAFKTAFAAAQAEIVGVTNKAFRMTDATALNTDLTNAYIALKTAEQYIDDSELQAVFVQYYALSSAQFTQDSYNALTDKINQALQYYNDNTYTAGIVLTDSDEDAAIYNQILADAQTALAGLRVNHDAKVVLENESVSYNSMLAAAEALDASKYANYTVLVEAISQAKLDMAALDNTDFTTVDAMLAAYTAILQNIQTAINALEYSFTLLPNGTVAKPATGVTVGSENAKTGNNSMVNTSDIKGSIALGFQFPNNGVFIRTTHEAATFDVGNMMLYWGAWRDYDQQLLFLNMNDTNTDTGELETWAVAAGQTPRAQNIPDNITKHNLTAGNVATGLGCSFAVEDLYCIEADSKINAIATDANGNYIADKSTNLFNTAFSTDTNERGTANALVMHGKGNNSFGGNTYSGKYTMSLPATQAAALTASTVPAQRYYSVNANVGAVANVYYQPMSAWCIFRHDVAAYTVSATVVDVSYLFDLIKECDAITDSSVYTTDSWKNFSDALTAAKSQMNYTQMTAAQITDNARLRYVNLWKAYQALELRTVDVVFNYHAADGSEVSKTVSIHFGDTILDKLADAGIEAVDYMANGYSYTFAGWSPVLTDSTRVDADAMTFTAQYTSKLEMANFDALDAAVDQLTALENRAYSVADLQALDAFIKGLTYYNMSAEDRAAANGLIQNDIDAETAQVAAYAIDKVTSVDYSAAEAAFEAEKAAKDSDAYDVSKLSTTELYQNVDVNGKTVEGLLYTDEAELNAAVKDILEHIEKVQYKIYLNGELIGTEYYGTRIEVNAEDKSISYNTDMEVNKGDANYAWYYSFDSVQVTQTTTPKYMMTAPSYGFVVKGNTYLTTAEAETDVQATPVVTFVNGINQHVFDVVYAKDGQVTIPDAPVCAFYTFTGYEGGYTAGATIDVTEDMTIVANYTETGIAEYEIDVSGYSDGWIGGSFPYNERITLTDDGTEVWVTWRDSAAENAAGDIVSGYQIVAYGPTVSFCVCEDVTIMGFALRDLEDYKDPYGTDLLIDLDDNGASSMIRNGVVKSSTKFSMIGSFALPEGAQAVEYGVLFTKADDKTLTLENASKDSTIKRLKGGKHTGENDSFGQYVISVKNPAAGSYTFTYRSYLTYTLNGKTYTVYATTPVTESVTF